MKPINEKTGFFFIVILVILIACHQGGLGHVRVDAEDDVGESHCLRKEAALWSVTAPKQSFTIIILKLSILHSHR